MRDSLRSRKLAEIAKTIRSKAPGVEVDDALAIAEQIKV